MYEDQRKQISDDVDIHENGLEIELANDKTDILIGTSDEAIEIHSENDTNASTIIEIVDYVSDRCRDVPSCNFILSVGSFFAL